MSTRNVKAGDRVRITGVQPEDPNPMPIGAEGTVIEAHEDTGQTLVDWDPKVGRSLILLTTDPFKVIS